MNISTVEKLVEIITGYEIKHKIILSHGYMNIDTFKIELKKEILQNGADELLKFYKTYSLSCDNTNLTPDQRKELDDLILILQGQATNIY